MILLFIAACWLLLVQYDKHKEIAHHPTVSKDTSTVADSSNVATATLPVVVFTYEQRQGRSIFIKYCSVCHGVEGKGDGFNAYNLDPKPRDLTDVHYVGALGDALLMRTILQGGKGVGKSPLMPIWGGRLNRMDIEYVIAYVRKLSQPQ